MTTPLALASLLLALQSTPEVTTYDHDNTVQPAVTGDEGLLRFSPTPLPPAPPRGFAGATPASPGITAPSRGIQYDALRGRETLVDLVPTAERMRWIPGRDLPGGTGEPSLAGWTGDLSAITSVAFPWSAQVRIVGQDSAGNPVVGSGTLIDAQNVITAGHCVHAGAGGTWHNSIYVYPAWDGDDDAFGRAFGSSYATFTGWTSSSNPDEDVAFIRLDRPVGFMTGWLGYGYDTNNSFYTANFFNLAAYPDIGSCYSGAPDQMRYGFGQYDTVTSGQLTASAVWTCDGNGMDGGGAYAILSGSRYVYGVHRDHNVSTGTISHTRLRQTHTDFYENSFRTPGYSTTLPDYVPLDVQVNTGGGAVKAGDPLLGMNYLVGNSSLFDPVGIQTHSVKVYLSTNNNISTFDTLIQTHTYDHDFGPVSSTRITVATPPVIPADTPSGTYWIGVITESYDDNSSNNDTDGRDAFQIIVEGCSLTFTPFGVGLPGSGGFAPYLFGTGNSCMAGGHTVDLVGALGGTVGNLWVSTAATDLYPVFGGHFYIDLSGGSSVFGMATSGPAGVPGAGAIHINGSDIRRWAGLTVHLQMTLRDAAAHQGVSMSNGLTLRILP